MSEKQLEHCSLCPRSCGTDRTAGQKGVCGETAELRLARAALHYWEEPCISGKNGSGAVFFCGCPLHCVYCQNAEIAAGQTGKAVSSRRLAEIFRELAAQGAHNINLVTPTHYVPQIAEAIRQVKAEGFPLPFVYNTSSYETVETLRQLEGLISIYLPDLKYVSTELSSRYSHAPDYFAAASQAIAEMVRQAGEAVFESGTGLMKRGVIVRHLLLPGCLADSRRVVKYLYETYGDRIYLSIMNQYTPMPQLADYPELNRKVSRREYERLVDYALELGVENGFIQEGETAEESFIPPFTCEGV